MSTKKYKTQLLSTGDIVERLHYGSFASNWWVFLGKKRDPKMSSLVPLRVNCRVRIQLNGQEIIIRIIEDYNNGFRPGFVSELDPESLIYTNITAAVNETYKKLFNNKTRYSGLDVIGLYDIEITSQLTGDIQFIPFQVYYKKIKLFIVQIGTSNNESFNFAGNGYMSTFIHKVRGDQCLIVQEIHENSVSVTVYKDGLQREQLKGASPNEVWKKMTICHDCDPMALFGLCDPLVIQAIEKHHNIPCCNFKDWDNLDIMIPIYKKNLKKKITTANIQWYQFFKNWQNQKSTIIELTSALASIYPLDYSFANQELCAWRRMMKDTGCTNITPFSKKQSQVIFYKFFSKNYISDRNLLFSLNIGHEQLIHHQTKKHC